LAEARPPTKELFQIIPMHMMNREMIPGGKEGLTMFSSKDVVLGELK